MYFTGILAIAIYVLKVVATPTPAVNSPVMEPYPQAVSFIPTTVTDMARLPQQPEDLNDKVKSFLATYQALENNVSASFGSKMLGLPENGWCFRESPCRLLTEPASAEIRSKDGKPLPLINMNDTKALIDRILAVPKISLKDHDVFRGLKEIHMQDDAVALHVYGVENVVPSDVLAASVFDTYKVHADDTSSNSARAVQQDSKFTVCLSPSGADPIAVREFCAGKELNGTLPLLTPIGPVLTPSLGAGTKRSDIRGRGISNVCSAGGAMPIISWIIIPICNGIFDAID